MRTLALSYIFDSYEPPCLFVILLVCCIEEVGDNFCNVLSFQVATNPDNLQAQPWNPKLNQSTRQPWKECRTYRPISKESSCRIWSRCRWRTACREFCLRRRHVMHDVNVTTCHLGDDVRLLAVGRCVDDLRVFMERRSYSVTSGKVRNWEKASHSFVARLMCQVTKKGVARRFMSPGTFWRRWDVAVSRQRDEIMHSFLFF